MTHSLHRRGTATSLKNDYVVLATPAIGVNDEGSGKKLKRILKIMDEIGANNIGDCISGSIYSGLTVEDVKKKLKDGGRVRGVFSDKEKTIMLLKRLKEENLGLSITISGLINEIFDICREVGLQPHSINLSLGVWGKKALLPKEEILEFTTMCGHHLISPHLVKKHIDLVIKGKMSPKKAIAIIAKPCGCGIFNVDRGISLLKEKSNDKCMR